MLRPSLLLLACIGLLPSCGGSAPIEIEPGEESTGIPLELENSHPAAAGNDERENEPGDERAVPEPALSREQLEDGWIQLFDGRTLFGWTANSGGDWSVVDGVIRAGKGKPGLLLTTVPFADYELRCDFRLEKGGNSGVFLRTVPGPKDPGRDCYELNICDSHKDFPTGCLVARHKIEKSPAVEGEWHTFAVRMVGHRIVVRLDDKPLVDFTDKSEFPRDRGRIGLQMNGGRIEFRNVLLKPLGTKPLFDGKSLAGWRVVPGSKSKFTVEERTIRVTDGPGFLETTSSRGDFILQAEARTNGTNLNSGIFFRAEPGTAKAPSNGYELQIHNGTKGGDRSRPANAGTGAIFRRNTARFVVSRDHEWAALTLLAAGPRFAVWVNGLQVTDWLDERKPHANPRRGLRLEAGHISLQGHDPTTDLAFRNLRVTGRSR